MRNIFNKVIESVNKPLAGNRKLACLLVFCLTFICTQAQPIADFEADTTVLCKPGLVKFQDKSTGGVSAWNWDFGNGATSTLQNPSLIYTVAGTYHVKLTVSGPGGTNTKTKTSHITILDLPVADFIYADSVICQDESIQFTDKSVAVSPGSSIRTWLWDFGDGNVSSSGNPNHQFKLSGTFTIKLRVWDSKGCDGFREKTSVIKVLPKPNTKFKADKQFTCTTPATIRFTALDNTAGNKYFWDFGNGNTDTIFNPSVFYANQGAYKVKLKIRNANGCIDSTEINGFVNIGANSATILASPDTICKGQSVSFRTTGAGSAVLFEWDFGDGQTSQDSTPTHAYGASGNYDIKLIVTYQDGCIDTIVKPALVRVDDIPNLAYTYRPAISCTAPFNATFVNTSAQPDGTFQGMTYYWEFGDGGTSNLRNPIHAYSGLGPYIVNLRVFTAGGCYATRTDTINFAPEIDITANSKYNCGSNASVAFSYTTNIPGTITKQSWNFGDGQTATTKTPSNFYSSEGTYIVALTLTSNTGCVFTGYDTVFVYEKPTADFEGLPRDTCVRKSVKFRNKSSSNATMFVWDFGDGSPPDTTYPNETVVSHLYLPLISTELPDSFDVTLIAFNGTCSDTLILPGYVKLQPPYAKPKLDPGLYCGFPATIYPIDQSLYKNPRDSVIRLWTFNDPKAPKCTTDTKLGINVGINCDCSRDSLPRHTYSDTGEYSVKLYLYSKRTKCADSAMVMAKVVPAFYPGFTVNIQKGCAPLTVTFNDTSKRGVKWFWDFGDLGDADTDIVKSPSYTYRRPGKYTVRLIVQNADGCEALAEYTDFITVRGPQANFTFTGSLCPPYPLTFKDNSINTSKGVKWLWRFGDGQTDTTQHPVHAYAKAGVYPVTLTVTDSEGCVNSVVRAINYQPPKPAFTFDKNIVCPGVAVTFTNKTPSPTLHDYTWVFEDGTTSSLFQPTHSYSDTGTYFVKLIAKRKLDGCMDSVIATDSIRVVIPRAEIYTTDTNGLCPPYTVNFKSNASDDIIEWLWDFGDSARSIVPNPMHTYNKPGKYTVKLKFVSAGGCVDSVERIDLISVNGPVGTFTVSSYAPCAPSPVFFQVNAVDAALYTWDFGDGNIETTSSDTITHTYLNGGTFIPVLILTDSNSCTMTYPGNDTIIVSAPPKPVFTVNPLVICMGDSFLFEDITGVPANYTRTWDFGDSTTATGAKVYHKYTRSGDFDISLRIRDTNGCESYTLKKELLRVFPEIKLKVSNDTIVCSGEPVVLWATGGTGYSWEQMGGAVDSSVSVSPTVSTTYKVYGFGYPGCDPKIAYIKVDVYPTPPVSAGADKVVCRGDSVMLYANGAASYAWMDELGTVIATTDSFWYKPVASQRITLLGTDGNGCTKLDTVSVNVADRPAVEIDGPEVVCYGAIVNLKAGGAETYYWEHDAANNLPESKVVVITDTFFVVKGANQGCMGDADTIWIEVNSDVLEAGFEPELDSIFEGQLVRMRNLTQGAVSYKWYMSGKLISDSLHPEIRFPRAGDYKVLLRATNEYNCEDEIEKTLKVYPFLLTFPNAFTPDGNNRNDIFRGYAPYPLYDVEFSIYSRWGEQLFISHDWNQGWNGQFKGVNVQEGVYTYVFTARMADGKSLLVSGTFTLLR